MEYGKAMMVRWLNEWPRTKRLRIKIMINLPLELRILHLAVIPTLATTLMGQQANHKIMGIKSSSQGR